MKLIFAIIISILPGLSGCEPSGGQHGGSSNYDPEQPVVCYRLNSSSDYSLYCINVRDGAKPQNISALLDSLGPLPAGGHDEFARVSRNGEWFLVATERFGNDGWAALCVVSGDLSSYSVIEYPGPTRIHGSDGAISSDGKTVAYVDGNDIYVTTEDSGEWTAPLCITSGSSFTYHGAPGFSFDETFIVLHAGENQYFQQGSVIASVNPDGSGFAVIYNPADRTGGTATNNLRHPMQVSDGSYVFESDWLGEQIWRLDSVSDPYLINADFHNDNTPCVVSGSTIVSLWLGRPGSTGVHELKVMPLDGSSYYMLLDDIDILDDSITAGGGAGNISGG